MKPKHVKFRDGIKRKFVHQDVTYVHIEGRTFRCLSFVKNDNLVQYEALVSTRGSSEAEKVSSGEIEVANNFLTSQYHNGIISGMMLISLYFNICNDFGDASKAVVLGLGAESLPMFMKKIQPSLRIEVVEPDPIFLDVTREYFGFKEGELLKVHITDKIKFVEELADSEAEEKIYILVVDVASLNTSSGLTCPRESFVEESFMWAAKESLSEQGLFVLNLISKCATVRDRVHSRLKKVFSNIFCLKLVGDENEVIFALKLDAPIMEEQLSEARNVLDMTLQQVEEPWSLPVSQFSKSVELLKW